MNVYGVGKRYVYELYAMVLVTVALFIACALYSYNPTDSSLLFYRSCVQRPITNWCGVSGAHCAALLFYVFGYAAYAICLFLVGLARNIVSHGIVNYDIINTQNYGWDRVFACALLPCVAAALCNLHGIGGSTIAGGIIGINTVTHLYRWCDYVGTALLLYVLLVSCLLVITQLSFLYILYSGICMISRVGAIVYARIAGLRMFYRLGLLIYMFGSCVINGVCAIYTMVLPYVRICVSIFFVTPRLKQCELCEVIVTEDDYRLLHMRHDLIRDSEHEVQEDYGTGMTERVSERARVDIRDNDEHTNTLVQESEQHDRLLHDTLILDNYQESDHEQTVSYVLPPISFFVKGVIAEPDASFVRECDMRAQLLQEKLAHFGIQGKVVAITRGPVVTLFEYQPHADVKLSKIMALEDDLAMALRALSIRIIAPIPGRSVVGFEIANAMRTDVLLADIIHAREYQQNAKLLPLILGQDTVGTGVIVDLARMPHLLVAGSTGSGKSVGLNSMLISLLCARTPDELKLILIDPKRLEFTPYEDIAHLLFPIITHTKTAVPVLKWVATHMDERYEKMAACGARHIFDYNKRYEQGIVSERMPFIVIIIDELADLMITVGREVEDAIARITQMARAAGIHLIVATQRPSVDVITGLIKVNFPSRISFRVTSRVDSRTILDCGGADKLLGRGDMLFLDASTSQVQRVHGAYVSDAEIRSVTDHIRAERTVQYLDIVTELQKGQEVIEEKDDVLYAQVLAFIDEIDSLSISLLQRKFKIGYNRSARIIDQLEASGRLMPANGSKQRRIIK